MTAKDLVDNCGTEEGCIRNVVFVLEKLKEEVDRMGWEFLEDPECPSRIIALAQSIYMYNILKAQGELK